MRSVSDQTSNRQRAGDSEHLGAIRRRFDGWSDRPEHHLPHGGDSLFIQVLSKSGSVNVPSNTCQSGPRF